MLFERDQKPFKKDQTPLRVAIVIMFTTLLLAVLFSTLRNMRDQEIRLRELEAQIAAERNELERRKAEDQEAVGTPAEASQAPMPTTPTIILGPIQSGTTSPVVTTSPQQETTTIPAATQIPQQAPIPDETDTAISAEPYVCLRACIGYIGASADSGVVMEFNEGDVVDVAGTDGDFYRCVTWKGPVYVHKADLESTFTSGRP